MALFDLQNRIKEYFTSIDKEFWPPVQSNARLIEEIGELAREVSIKYGKKDARDFFDRGTIAEESADIIWTLSCLVGFYNLDLDDYLNQFLGNITKDYIPYQKNIGLNLVVDYVTQNTPSLSAKPHFDLINRINIGNGNISRNLLDYDECNVSEKEIGIASAQILIPLFHLMKNNNINLEEAMDKAFDKYANRNYIEKK